MRTKTTLALALSLLGLSSTAQAESLDTIPVWSLIMEVHTCDISNGGTDDGVSLILDGANEVELDLPHDERNRNDWDMYELAPFLTTGIHGAAFPDRPTLVKRGSDQWCIDEINFYVNGTFTPVASVFGQRKLDSQGGNSNVFQLPNVRVSSATVSSSWGNASAISGIRNRVTQIDDTHWWRLGQTVIGHYQRFEPAGGNKFKWGGRGSVDVMSAAPSTLNFDLDWVYYQGGIIDWKGGGALVNIRISCTGGALSAAGAGSSSDWSSQLWAIGNATGGNVQRVLNAVSAINGNCGSVTFSTDGDIYFF